MKKLLLIGALLIAGSIPSLVGCKTETPPPPPPPPEPTAIVIPDPTEVPTPAIAVPCRQQSFSNQWKGDCAPGPECVGPDSAGFYIGKACKQKGTP